MPIMKITEAVGEPSGTTWLTSAASPKVPSTPDSASRTGIPAATSPPNASSRMASVTGSDRYPAPLEVSGDGFVERTVPAGGAELLDHEPGMGTLQRVNRSQDGRDLVGRVVGRSHGPGAHRHADQRRRDDEHQPPHHGRLAVLGAP